MLYEDCRVGVDEGESIVGKITLTNSVLEISGWEIEGFRFKTTFLSLYITPSYTFYLSCLRLAFHIQTFVFPNYLLFCIWNGCADV